MKEPKRIINISERIRNQIRIHWPWLRKQDHQEVASFINAIIKNIHGELRKR